MSIDERKDVVRKFWEGPNNGDLDSQLALLADDAVFNVTGATGVSGSHRGVGGVRRIWSASGHSSSRGRA